MHIFDLVRINSIEYKLTELTGGQTKKIENKNGSLLLT